MLGASSGFALMSTCVAAAHVRSPETHTLVSSFIRAIVNLLALVVMTRGSRRLLIGDARVALWIRGVTGAASLLLYFAAIDRTSAGEAAFLNNTSAFWVAALAPVLLGEATGGNTWIAIAGSIMGTALLGFPRADAGSSDWLGRAFGLTSGLTAALAYLSVRRAATTNASTVIVFYFTLLATLTCVIGLPFVDARWPTDPLTWVLLGGAGLFATIAQVLMTGAYAIGPTAPLAAVAAATPLFTTALAITLLGQVPDGMAIAGMAVLTASGIGLPLLSSRNSVTRTGEAR